MLSSAAIPVVARYRRWMRQTTVLPQVGGSICLRTPSKALMPFVRLRLGKALGTSRWVSVAVMAATTVFFPSAGPSAWGLFELRRPAALRPGVRGGALRAPAAAGLQGCVPPGGLCGAGHGHVQGLPRGGCGGAVVKRRREGRHSCFRMSHWAGHSSTMPSSN